MKTIIAHVDMVDWARREMDALMALPAEALAPSRSTFGETAERVRAFEAWIERTRRLLCGS